MNWRNPLNLADIEHALDASSLYVRVGVGRYWQCRRNGATKTWKTRPSEYRIPIKYGFRGYHAITQSDALDMYRIAASREAAERPNAEG